VLFTSPSDQKHIRLIALFVAPTVTVNVTVSSRFGSAHCYCQRLSVPPISHFCRPSWLLSWDLKLHWENFPLRLSLPTLLPLHHLGDVAWSLQPIDLRKINNHHHNLTPAQKPTTMRNDKGVRPPSQLSAGIKPNNDTSPLPRGIWAGLCMARMRRRETAMTCLTIASRTQRLANDGEWGSQQPESNPTTANPTQPRQSRMQLQASWTPTAANVADAPPPPSLNRHQCSPPLSPPSYPPSQPLPTQLMPPLSPYYPTFSTAVVAASASASSTSLTLLMQHHHHCRTRLLNHCQHSWHLSTYPTFSITVNVALPPPPPQSPSTLLIQPHHHRLLLDPANTPRPQALLTRLTHHHHQLHLSRPRSGRGIPTTILYHCCRRGWYLPTSTAFDTANAALPLPP